MTDAIEEPRPSRAGETPAPATLAQVARRVGVSLNTVSRALRAPRTVRPELRRRIEAVMDEVGYVPNRLAGSLAGTRADLVGVVVTSLFHSEFAAVVEGLQAGLAERDIQVMLGNSHYDPEQEWRIVRSMLSWRPAAVAIVGLDHHPRAAALLAGSGVPVVEMWDAGGPAIDSAVGMDHDLIGRAQAAHLVARGCRRLAYLGSLRPHDARARKRAGGAAACAGEAGLPPLAVRTAPVPGSPDLGARLLAELMGEDPGVDGIVCNSDATAFGALRQLRALGRRVPDEVRVIGFGDDEAADCVTPALTSFRPPRREIGRAAAETILARLDGAAPRRTVLGPTLVERASTGMGAGISMDSAP